VQQIVLRTLHHNS